MTYGNVPVVETKDLSLRLCDILQDHAAIRVQIMTEIIKGLSHDKCTTASFPGYLIPNITEAYKRLGNLGIRQQSVSEPKTPTHTMLHLV